jgi:hypothetical protein
VRGLRLVALTLLVVTACAGPGSSKRTQAEQDKDGKTIATAIAGADQGGASFHMDETLTFTGGDIPSNQQLQVKATADGVAKDGRIRMTYRIAASRSRTISYDMVVADTVLYAKPHASAQWKRTPAASATALFPTLRLRLVRESVLLAKEVDASSVTNSSGGFAHRYRVVPAADQLEQLQAIPVTGTQQQALFLKTATAEIDAFLSLSGDRLQRLETHLSGTDPTNGEIQKVDCNADFKAAKVNAIQTPTGATTVTPDQILNQT